MEKYPIDLEDLNRKRISRAGSKLWAFVTSIKPKDVISGEGAMRLIDTYGIKPSDLIFFLSILGVSIDMKSFYPLLREAEEKRKRLRPCEAISS